MKARADGYSHFNKVEIAGDVSDAGNGIQLAPAAASATPTITAVGDDTNVGLTFATKGTGVLKLQSNSLDRLVANPTAKTIVDGSATSLFEVAAAAGVMVGGVMDFLVRASNGTDHQAIAGTVVYSAVNKAGTTTATVTQQTGEAKAVSSGTLTLAFSITDDTNKATVKLTPTGSLTETLYTIEYTVYPLRGAVTIL